MVDQPFDHLKACVASYASACRERSTTGTVDVIQHLCLRELERRSAEATMNRHAAIVATLWAQAGSHLRSMLGS